MTTKPYLIALGNSFKLIGGTFEAEKLKIQPGHPSNSLFSRHGRQADKKLSCLALRYF